MSLNKKNAGTERVRVGKAEGKDQAHLFSPKSISAGTVLGWTNH